MGGWKEPFWRSFSLDCQFGGWKELLKILYFEMSNCQIAKWMLIDGKTPSASTWFHLEKKHTEMFSVGPGTESFVAEKNWKLEVFFIENCESVVLYSQPCTVLSHLTSWTMGPLTVSWCTVQLSDQCTQWPRVSCILCIGHSDGQLVNCTIIWPLYAVTSGVLFLVHGFPDGQLVYCTIIWPLYTVTSGVPCAWVCRRSAGERSSDRPRLPAVLSCIVDPGTAPATNVIQH